MYNYAVAGLLLLASAFFKAVQDNIAHHNSLAHLGRWWDSTDSWKLKYKCFSQSNGWTDNVQWHPVQPLTPRFFGSTTLFVALTDAWHAFQLLNYSAWQAALCLLLPFPWYQQLAAFFLLKLGYGGFFELLYRKLSRP